jgi:hypothetical protein
MQENEEWGWIESESKTSINDSLEIRAENRKQYVSEKSVEKKMVVQQVISTHTKSFQHLNKLMSLKTQYQIETSSREC